MRSLTLWALGAMTLVYLACLYLAYDGTRSYRRQVESDPSLVLLAPLRDGSRTTTNIGTHRIRRYCEAGRCELMAGERTGFSLLASYPSDHWVTLRRGGRLEVQQLRPWYGPRLRGVRLRWICAGVLGGLLFSWLVVLGRRLKAEIRRLGPARDASLDGVGWLTFRDGGDRALAQGGTSPGWVTALWPLSDTGAPFRDSAAPRWVTIEGTRDGNLTRRAQALGAQRMLTRGLVLVTLASPVLAWL